MTEQAQRWPASTVALWILTVVAVLMFMRAAHTLLIPIALAVLTSYALEPMVGWLERHRVPRVAGAGLVLLLVLTTAGGAAYSLKADAAQLLAALPRAAERARDIVQSRIGLSVEGIDETVGVSGSSGTPRTSERSQSDTTSSPAVGAFLQRGVVAVFALAGHLVVIVFLTYFLLIAGGRVRTRLIEIVGTDRERRRVAAATIDEINVQIQRYLLVLLATAAVVGAATWAVLAWMGVQHAAMWGILAGALNSIPYFGPIIVAGALFVVGLVQGGGVTQALQMSGVAIVITSLEGWLLTPPLMGKAERMGALAVFLGLLLWTWVWGALGTILAVPMLVVIKSVADHVERLRPIGRLLAP